jgi:hypothetical protein
MIMRVDAAVFRKLAVDVLADIIRCNQSMADGSMGFGGPHFSAYTYTFVTMTGSFDQVQIHRQMTCYGYFLAKSHVTFWFFVVGSDGRDLETALLGTQSPPVI